MKAFFRYMLISSFALVGKRRDYFNRYIFYYESAKMSCLLCNDGGTAWMFEFAGVKT